MTFTQQSGPARRSLLPGTREFTRIRHSDKVSKASNEIWGQMENGNWPDSGKTNYAGRLDLIRYYERTESPREAGN